VRLPDPALLVVTDRKQAQGALTDIVAAALAAGCRWISLREKDLPETEQIAILAAMRPLTRQWGACLTLHGAVALARTAEADGVHLPSGSDAAAARAALGADALIGISIHSVVEAERLDAAVVDYAVAGPAFATPSKPGYGPVLGLRGLAAIVRASSVPIIAIGGIEVDAVGEVLDAGAGGVAVMGSVMRAARPGDTVASLVAALEASHTRSKRQQPDHRPR
jgi:thiamine-phosphate pyrophosphorylase